MLIVMLYFGSIMEDNIISFHILNNKTMLINSVFFAALFTSVFLVAFFITTITMAVGNKEHKDLSLHLILLWIVTGLWTYVFYLLNS